MAYHHEYKRPIRVREVKSSMDFQAWAPLRARDSLGHGYLIILGRGLLKTANA